MSDRTQIGPAVDEQLWKEFRADVHARHGQVRGVLGDELETAIREYLDGSPSPAEQEIIDRLDRLERAAGVSAPDGGTDTSEGQSHTHAPSRLDSPDKPAANAATDKKVAYLASRLSETVDLDPDEEWMGPRKVLVDIVKEEYSFRSDTAKRYVEDLIDHFGLQEHPGESYSQLVTEPRYQKLMDERREAIEDELDGEQS